MTGASSGIGTAIARALAAEGAKLILAARREDRLRAIADHITRTGGEALVLPVDLADGQATLDLVNQAHTHWGRLDILINNPGVVDLAPIETADVNS